METTIKTQVNEILVKNNLDFKIKKVPLFGQIDAENVVKSEYYGLYNTKSENIINTVKSGYTVTQNDEIVELVLRGSQNFGNLSVYKAGSINDGRKIYIQLQIAGNSNVNGDEIKKYITILDSNDGSSGLSVGIGDLTMSCQNQFFKFYKAGIMKFRHTVTIEQKLKEVPFLIKTALNESLKQIELYRNFESTKISRDLAHQLVKEVTGVNKLMSTKELADISGKKFNAMETLYKNIDIEMNSKGSNLWGLHSGVTRWTTHEKSAPTRENGRIESIITGTNYKSNQQSLEFCKTQLETVYS